MLKTFARAAAVAAALLCATAALAQKSFVRDDLASEGVRLEEKLKTEAGSTAAGRPAAQLRRDAEGLMSRSNQRGAMSLYAAAIALEPKNAANWVGFVKAVKAITPKDYTERYQLRERGTAAAYVAYQRATTRPAEAEALALLGDLYVMSEDWRPALNAYAASLQLADEPALRKTYEELREKHGFRITNYKVDSDSASPRVCFNFSEPLAQGRVDFGPFVAVSGAANAAITTESSQLCVDGLKHGERYAFVLRQGLPSSVGESLLKSADYEVYVRDRSPQVRFTGRNYVLPRTGQEGIPLVSVNTAGAEVEIYRIGDRNLLPTVRSEEFLGQINRSAAETIATEKGRKIWSGIARDEVRAQSRRGHGLPGHRGRRQARARRLRHDRASEGRRAGRGGLQRQGDAVVRRLRPRAHRLQGQGRRARARALARDAPSRSPMSRSASSPATTTCWRRNRPTPPAMSPSIPASRAARAATRRA